MPDLHNRSVQTNPAVVVDEAQRYLALVDLFRAQGCEPHWRPEPSVAKRRRATNGGTR